MRREPIEYLEPAPVEGLTTVVRGIISALDPQGQRTPETAKAVAWSPELETQINNHRIAPLACFAGSAGHLAIAPEVQHRLRSTSRQAAITQLKLVGEAQKAIAALTANGIETRVLKGLATGALDYPRFAIRQTGDVDLLVKKRDFARACDTLASLPAENLKAEEPTPLLVESTFRTASGTELDLHHRLFRTMPAHEDLLFARPAELPEHLGLALSTEGRLVHAAGHLLLSPPGYRRLSSVFDVVRLEHHPDLDHDRLDSILDAFQLRDTMTFARWLTGSLAGRPLDQPSVRRSINNHAHLRHDRSLLWETAAVLTSLAPRDRWRYLRYQARRAIDQRRPGTEPRVDQ